MYSVEEAECWSLAAECLFPFVDMITSEFFSISIRLAPRTERMTGGITLVFTLCQALFCTLRMRNLTLPLPQTEALYTEEETEDRRSESKSHSVVSNSLRPHGLNSPWHSPGQNTGGDSHSLLQGLFPIQELNQGLLHCRQILYQLSSQGSLISERK